MLRKDIWRNSSLDSFSSEYLSFFFFERDNIFSSIQPVRTVETFSLMKKSELIDNNSYLMRRRYEKTKRVNGICKEERTVAMVHCIDVVVVKFDTGRFFFLSFSPVLNQITYC